MSLTFDDQQITLVDSSSSFIDIKQGTTFDNQSGFFVAGLNNQNQIQYFKTNINGSIKSVIEPFPTFSVLAQNISVANGKSMISIVNQSNKIIKIQSIKIINVQNNATTGIVAQFQFTRCNNHTNGINLTPQTFDTIDNINPLVSFKTNATISGSSSIPLLRYYWSSDEWGPGTLDTESFAHGIQNLIFVYKNDLNQKPITLRQNQGFTINQQTNSSSGTFDIEIIFTQEDE